MLNLYDSTGHAVAYVDDESIYLWGGKPVAWVSAGVVYDYSGWVVGWLSNGWLTARDETVAFCTARPGYRGLTTPTLYATPATGPRGARPA